MANIRDVAREAGVSVATVSRFINSKGYVSAEAKSSIAAAIEALNYVPSTVARSLNTKQAAFIGLIVPDIVNPFFPELARAVEDIAYQYGYTVVLCNSDEKAEKEIHYVHTLQQEYAAGFIVAANYSGTDHFTSVNVPIVAIDRQIHPSIPYVMTNNREGAKIGTEHLLANGCRHILCMRGPTGLGPADERFLGFNDAVEGKGIDIHTVESPFSFDAAENCANEALKKYPIDGIFASSDISAAGAMKAAYSLGISVPDQLQIVGYDGTALSSQLTPSLTTVAQDLYKIGTTAAKMLIKKIEGQTLIEPSVRVPAKLVVRETTRRKLK